MLHSGLYPKLGVYSSVYFLLSMSSVFQVNRSVFCSWDKLAPNQAFLSILSNNGVSFFINWFMYADFKSLLKFLSKDKSSNQILKLSTISALVLVIKKSFCLQWVIHIVFYDGFDLQLNLFI